MPLYEYLCTAGHRTEEYRPIARSSEGRVCECGARAWRVLSPPRIVARIATRTGFSGASLAGGALACLVRRRRDAREA